MSTLDAKLVALQRFRRLREDEVDSFLELVAELVDLGDVRAIPALLNILDDNCPLSGVMDAVSRNLEEFPRDVYVPLLLENLVDLSKRAPFWCENEIRKCLWDPASRRSLISHAHAATDEAQETLRALLHEISFSTPTLAEACAEVQSSI